MDDELTVKVEDWLTKQGFPLEFQVAREFAAAGFHTDQGTYVPDPKEDTLREIDVVASTEHVSGGRKFRFSVVAECKWSREKPWVVFTSRQARPALDASIAHLVGSPFAEAVLWLLARDQQFQAAQRDILPKRAGFGGRQALTGKQDKELFYPTVQSVAAAASSFSRRMHVTNVPITDLVRDVHIVMPAVVIDGRLFEAYLDGAELKVAETTRLTLSWRGFSARLNPPSLRFSPLKPCQVTPRLCTTTVSSYAIMPQRPLKSWLQRLKRRITAFYRQYQRDNLN